MKKIFSKKIVKYTVGIVIIVIASVLLYKSPIVQNKLAGKVVVEKTTVVKKGDIEFLVSGTGPVYYGKTASISSKVNSKVTNIYFKEGDRVKAGDLICDFDDSAAILTASQSKNALVTNQLSNDANATLVNKLNIVTPFSGQITNIVVKQGDVVQKGGELFTIADTSKLKLAVEFNAADINKISVNQSVDVNITSLMQSVKGKVTYKSDKAISTSAGGKLYTVEITMNNPGALSEGMKADASIETSSGSISSTNSEALEYINKTTVISETGGSVNYISMKKNQQINSGSVVIKIKNDDVTLNKEIGISKITDSEIQIASTESLLGDYKIYAPIDGIIAKQIINKGDSIIMAQPVTTIEETNVVQVDVDIDELEIAKVAIGQKAKLTVDAIPGTTTVPIEGEVVKIALDGISKNGVTNFAVTIKANGIQSMLKGGMNLSAEIETKSTTNVLYLPKEAIKKASGKSIVKVKEGNGNIVEKEVKVGASNGSIVEIRSGLSLGTIVILPGNK
ncbi:efflux RND transporter periplasmic adaptor subunit [Clostridium sp.]